MDAYHTCYALSGLALAQHTHTGVSEQTGLSEHIVVAEHRGVAEQTDVLREDGDACNGCTDSYLQCIGPPSNRTVHLFSLCLGSINIRINNNNNICN